MLCGSPYPGFDPDTWSSGRTCMPCRKKVMSECLESPDKKHTWMSEERYDSSGELDSWDLYCEHCGTFRDWSVNIPEEDNREELD